jgi:hypothetical protein
MTSLRVEVLLTLFGNPHGTSVATGMLSEQLLLLQDAGLESLPQATPPQHHTPLGYRAPYGQR